MFQDPELTTELEMGDDGGVPHTKYKEPFFRYRPWQLPRVRYPKETDPGYNREARTTLLSYED